MGWAYSFPGKTETSSVHSIWYKVKSLSSCVGLNWAPSWENLFMPYANNKGTDQPAHLRTWVLPGRKPRRWVCRDEGQFCLDYMWENQVLLADRHLRRRTTKSPVRPAKTQISLRPVWSES